MATSRDTTNRQVSRLLDARQKGSAGRTDAYMTTNLDKEELNSLRPMLDKTLGAPRVGRQWIIQKNEDGTIDATLFDNKRMRGVTRRTLSNQPSIATAPAEEDVSPTRPSAPMTFAEDRLRGPDAPESSGVDLSGMAPRPNVPMRFQEQADRPDDVSNLPVDLASLAPKTQLPVRRYEAERPDTVDRAMSSLESERMPFATAPPDALDTPTTKVDNPEPVVLDAPKEETPDVKKVESSKTLTEVVLRSQDALGTYSSPKNEVLVTNEALEEAESPEPTPPYRLVIDPNQNRAEILDAVGNAIEDFAVGTGDTTGTRYGKKYFSPVGTWRVVNEVPYEQMEGSYGPIWMGLTAKSYGLHGPHAAADIAPSGDEFVNEGFVSHGCIRFTERDMLKVGEYLDVGATVEILPYRTRPSHLGPLRVVGN